MLFAAGQEEAPIVSEEKPVLRFLGPSSSFNPQEYPVAAAIEELTGYEVQWNMLPQENALQKLNLELAAGTPYDLIKYSDMNVFHDLVAKQALQPIDGYIAEYAPRIQAVLSDSPYFEVTRVDGELYGLSSVLPNDRDVTYGIAVPVSLLESLGSELPTTLDQFEDLLRDVKELTDMVPLTGSGWMVRTIASAFNVVPDTFTVEDGRLVVGPKQSGLKDYLSYMAMLYEEGLIDPEWPVNTGSNIQEKFIARRAAMNEVGWWGIPPLIRSYREKVEEGGAFEYIVALEGVNGEQKMSALAGPPNFVAVPRSAGNPEHAFIFLNEVYQSDNFRKIVLGEEGVHYRMDDEGLSWPIEPAFFDERSQAHWYYAFVPGMGYSEMWQTRLRKDADMFEAYRVINSVPDSAKAANPLVFAGDIGAVGTYEQSLNQLAGDFYTKFIAGGATLSDWDQFMSDWENSGGREMEAAAQEWYRTNQ